METESMITSARHKAGVGRIVKIKRKDNRYLSSESSNSSAGSIQRSSIDSREMI